MGLLKTLQTYSERRLRLPVTSSDLVLDVGGGDQPHWRADVIVDRFPEADHTSQRFLGGGMRIDRPVFAVDAGDLPFRSQSFGYAVCSHTLEHVPDPAAAIAEMCRVAPRGYIEVPWAGMTKIHDFATHLWWCTIEDDTLVFRAKHERAFDHDIEQFLDDAEIRREFHRMATRNFDRCILAIRWEGELKVRVEGTPNMALTQIPSDIDLGRVGFTRASQAVTSSLSRTTWGLRRRRSPLTLGSISDDRRFGPLDVALEPRIYRSAES